MIQHWLLGRPSMPSKAWSKKLRVRLFDSFENRRATSCSTILSIVNWLAFKAATIKSVFGAPLAPKSVSIISVTF